MNILKKLPTTRLANGEEPIITSDMVRLWTIYFNPKDHPGYFVLREFIITDKGPVAAVRAYLAHTLEDARSAVPEGRYNLGRQPDDDPVIVETWI